MAKKTTAKKTAKKSSAKARAAKKPAPKKVAKKPAPKPMKKAAAKSPSAKAGAPAKLVGMHPVHTGNGPSAFEVGKDVVNMFNRGQLGEIESKYWSPDVASIEGMGVGLGWYGLKAVREKNEGWMKDHVLHGATAEGPFVGSSGFSIRFRMDVETKSTGERKMFDEVGVYQVQNGKIVREEFMYGV